MKRRRKRPIALVDLAPVNFGPCQFCEYEPTSAFAGMLPWKLLPTCDLCVERLNARAGLLRQPEFYVI